MFEKPNKLNMTLEGEVIVSSGELLIIDPCYVPAVDIKWFNRFLSIYSAPEGRKIRKIEREEHKCFMNLTASTIKRLEALEEAITKGKSLSVEYLQLHPEKKWELYLRLIQENDKLKREIFAKWKSSPPYLIQGDGRVYFNTPYGDGLFSVNQRRDGYTVDLNHMGAKPGAIGVVAADIAMLMITDSKNVAIDDTNSTFKGEVDDKVYCRVEVTNGVYTCRFTKDNNKIIISNPKRKNK